MSRRVRGIAGLLTLMVVPAAVPKDEAAISADIERRTGHGLRSGRASVGEQPLLPPGVSLDDGISEDEAVAVALWNNPQLRAAFADLSVARADLVEAGVLVNPDLQLLFGVGSKPFELLLGTPIEALWQRPKRVAAAKLHLEKTSETLVQRGLDLARDVRLAHADYSAALDHARLHGELAKLTREIAELTKHRLRAGDISELDARLVEIEALRAGDRMQEASQEINIAWERLRPLMGLPKGSSSPSASETKVETLAIGATEELVEIAVSSRPDMRAAELSVEAAGRRLGWERSRTLGFVAPLLSSKAIGTSGIKTGPGLAVEIPAFDRNQGKISRAKAEVEQAALRYAALREQVGFEVGQAAERLRQAQDTLGRIRDTLLPGIREVVGLAEKAHAAGEISYLDRQLAERPLRDIEMRAAQAAAAVQRARAELSWAVGRRL